MMVDIAPSSRLGLDAIQALIPHRPPILLVDEILAWRADEWIETQRTFPADDPFFNGHFPGNPLLPGVYSVEAIAQSAALLTSLSKGLNAETATYLFVGLDSVRFKNPVLPGQTVTYRCEKEFEKMGIFRYKGRAHVNGATVAEATFTAKLILTQPTRKA
jgi:3-hydroxyacyl-[acyl-carrier-protein] dehydratase